MRVRMLRTRTIFLTCVCVCNPTHFCAGDEPTRYGDWERQGKAIDF